jgi:hypothetical protein
VFPFSGDRLAPLGRYALSYRVGFESLSDTDLGPLVAACRQSSPSRPQHGRRVLQRMLRAMDQAPDQAHPETRRLMPALDASCGADPFTRWPSQVAITGIITPWDADENPYPVEVFYDWSLPGQRTRIFSDAKASGASQDFLLLRRRGFTVTHHDTGSRTCRSVLPGTVRPDWQERAPCRCRGVIRGVTPLSPLGTTRVLACPLAAPRQAWAWYHVSGTPALFMVTSLRGDEGHGLFALFDYRDWRPGHPAPSATFQQPAECAAAHVEGPRPALRCGSCHMDARR